MNLITKINILVSQQPVIKANLYMLGDQHGEVQFSRLHGCIIVSTLIGSFNGAGARVYVQGIKRIINSLHGEPFAILVDNSDMHGATPEAYEELERYNQWSMQKNLVAKAFIIPSKATIEIVKSHSPSITRQNIKSFKDKASAIEWLEEQLGL